MKKWLRQTLKVEHWQVIAVLMVIYDIIMVNFSYFLGLWLRFDCAYSEIPDDIFIAFVRYIPIHAITSVIIFALMKLYNSIWRFASFHELVYVFMGSCVSSVLHTIGITVAMQRMPISYYVFGAGFQFVFILGIRFSYRLLLIERNRARKIRRGAVKRVMLIGAGNAGQTILRDVMQNKNEGLKICCIIDDNPNKWGRNINGVPVVGDRNTILKNARRYRIDIILLAIPSASEEEKSKILNICKESGCELKNLPGICQIINGEVRLSDIKDVAVEDLLGREPIRVDMEQIYGEISGKTILVTGGGGSIGSELCRQVAGHHPRQLIIFDVYENNAYDIEQELRTRYPQLNLKVLIGSVRDSRCMENVFSTYKPDIVYHAAAHKHVPLMETSPCEAIKNNVIGTYKTAYAALRHGCRRFVLISTDKAVNPTNIMGASKRLCEMVVQSFDRAVKDGTVGSLPQLFTHREDNIPENFPIAQANTEFVAVRFGNVLGSNGSVIPLFKKQIAEGGPVTVTHPDIIRYFMTIPEAVSLVMQAGTYAAGGEIFVLDMGAPVKIDELARNLIKLSGYTPDRDIQVVYTGLRPGEKLYEEKLMAEEGMQKTPNDLIHIGNPIPFDTQEFLVQLRCLMDAAYKNDAAICEAVAAMVPTYHPALAATAIKDATYEALRRETVSMGS